MFNNFWLYIYCTDDALKRLWILLSSSEDCRVLLEQLVVLSGAGFKFFFIIKAIFIILLGLGYGPNRFQWELLAV